MKALLIIALVALQGCAQLAGVTPSLQYCDEVDYQRKDATITLKAKCRAPIGSSLLR